MRIWCILNNILMAQKDMFGFLNNGSNKNKDVESFDNMNNKLIELFGGGYNLLTTLGKVVLVLCILISGIKIMFPQSRMSRLMADNKIKTGYIFVFGVIFFLLMYLIDLAIDVGSNFSFI